MGYVGPDGKVSEQFDPGFIWYAINPSISCAKQADLVDRSHPKPFKCSFKVRSPEAEALLRDLGMSMNA